MILQIVAAVALWCVPIALGALLWWMETRLVPSLAAIAERSPDGPNAEEITRSLSAMSRRLDDVDDASENRFRRINARLNRERKYQDPDELSEQLEGEEPIPAGSNGSAPHAWPAPPSEPLFRTTWW